MELKPAIETSTFAFVGVMLLVKNLFTSAVLHVLNDGMFLFANVAIAGGFGLKAEFGFHSEIEDLMHSE